MKTKLRTVIKLLLALVLLAGLAGVIWQKLDYQKGKTDYFDAERLAGLPQQQVTPAPAPAEEEPQRDTDPYAQVLAETDLAALREVNDDVTGWLYIPNTEISYPIVQGDDNDYYLDHTWKKEKNSVGSIFLEYRTSSDLSDFNTILYGHRMRNGSMFGSLQNYNSSSYWEQAPSIYIKTENGIYRYNIFAAYEADVSQLLYIPGISERTEKQAVLEYALTHSAIETGIAPTTEDHILSLITCTGRGYSTRWVVQAVLRDDMPSSEAS